MEPSILIGKPGDWMRSTVRSLQRILNWPPKFAARKIVRAPGRLALSKNMGNGDGTVGPGAWRPENVIQMNGGDGAVGISSIERRPRRLKMTMPNGGANSSSDRELSVCIDIWGFR